LFLHSYSIIICIITLSDHSNSGKNTNEVPFMTKTSRFFHAFLFYAYFYAANPANPGSAIIRSMQRTLSHNKKHTIPMKKNGVFMLLAAALLAGCNNEGKQELSDNAAALNSITEEGFIESVKT